MNSDIINVQHMRSVYEKTYKEDIVQQSQINIGIEILLKSLK